MVEMEDAHIEGNVTTVSKLWSTFLKTRTMFGTCVNCNCYTRLILAVIILPGISFPTTIISSLVALLVFSCPF